MPVIDVEVARSWAKERWPSPVVRRCVDDLLAHCPRTKEIPKITCARCRRSVPMPEHIDPSGGNLLICTHDLDNPFRSVWADSTCDDAEEREE